MLVVESLGVAQTSETNALSKNHVLACIAGVLVGFILGYLGWVLPSPGESLVTPTLIVAGTGLGISVCGALFAFLPPHRLEAVTWAGVVLTFTLLASVWTYQFSLPAHVAWDSSSTARAKAILFRLNQGNLNVTVPPQPCITFTKGSIGPLDAPYRACATSTSEGHFVMFTTGGVRSRGITYTDLGAETFLDECFKHLDGSWYMFTSGDLSNPANPCPIGYEFQGGP